MDRLNSGPIKILCHAARDGRGSCHRQCRIVHSNQFFYHRHLYLLTTSRAVRATRSYTMNRRLLQVAFGFSFIVHVLAHPHPDDLTEDEANKPVDTILWIHMFLQAIVWGVMFPLGMVLGITRSRFHVPLQVSSC